MVRNRKLSAFATILLILAFALSGAVFSISNNSDTIPAEAASTSAAAYLNVNNSFVTNVLQGQQKDYVYLGNYVMNGAQHSAGYGNNKLDGAIKWKVLSKNDTKYGDGNSLLLWSDRIVGVDVYNLYFANKAYAYYGTSLLRAMLNGTQYCEQVSDSTTIPNLINYTGTTYYDGLFKGYEKNYIVACNSVESYNFIAGLSGSPNWKTSIASTYYTNLSSAAAKFATASGGYVKETISGDMLFCLDYDDINNVNYGMGDNGVTYIQMLKNKGICTSWSSSLNGYPGWTESQAGSEYLTIPVDFGGTNYYFMRMTGINPNRDSGNHSLISVVGHVGAFMDTTDPHGIRPALNFNPEDILYANAHNQKIISTTFTSLVADEKPAYKLYFKDSTFTDTKKASFDKIGNQFSVTFTSANANAQKAVALLSSKTATNNAVTYEADASIVGNKATFTIPAGVNLRDYKITVLLTTDNGDFSTETVYEQYTIDSISASYYGFINGADSADFNGGNAQTVAFGGALYQPQSSETAANHKFLGWTTDKTDNSKKYTSIPDDFSSEMKFYAVWDVNTISAGLTLNTSSIEYLLGKIKIEPNITVSDMSDLEFTAYDWKKGGSSTGDTSDFIELENVSESGTYSLGYTIRSQSEPLWGHSGTTSSETVTITPGQLTPQSITVDKPAYYGMDLGSFTPTAVMHNSKGEPVSGTTHWVYSLGKINENPADPNYIADKYYAEFYFVPNNSYNGNYVSGKFTPASGSTPESGANYDQQTSTNIVYFDVEHIKVIFNLTQLSDTLSYNVTTYNGPISYSKIAKEFDTLWAKYYADNKTFLDGLGIGGYTPEFKHQDGRFYKISEYRTKSGGYNNVTANVTIDVNFVEAKYSVTYKYADEAGTPDKIENDKLYGQQILKPSPNPTNGALMFLGWYYPATDDNGDPIIEAGVPKLDKWDFDVNCIFGDTVLTARWLKAERLDRIEVTPNKPSYNALNSLVAGDLTVTAIFIAKDEDGNEVEMPVVLEFSEYKDGIDYVGNLTGDTTLHVMSDGSLTQIDVTYSYFNDGTDYSDTKTVWLPVNPRKIDVSDLDIKDKYVIYDGKAHSFDPISLATAQHLADPNSRHINGIDYTYYSGRTVVQPEDIIEIGDYTVVIGFTTNDPDYAVDPINAMLYIVSELPPGVEPENPPTPGDEGNGPSFIDKLLASHFPLWQVIVMAVSTILAIVFIVKAAQYGSRAKKANDEAKKLNAKTYAAILPIFAPDIVALGLSNKIWSIMAFAFAGWAVAMLIVALLMRLRWKKAEAAKEAAIEDNEQRKTEAQEAKLLAREEARDARQRELQETLIIAAQGSGGGLPADNSALEQRLIEMEERHREEMARRDEERRQEMDAMRMMLAGFMGGRQQGDEGFAYASMDDTDMLVQRVIAGLLPAMQQMMPEATAYLNAPQEQNEELIALVEEQKAIVEEQNEEIRNMSAQMSELQAQIVALSEDRAESVVVADTSEEINALTAQIASMQEQLNAMAQDRTDGIIIENGSDEKMSEMAEAMQQQLAKIEELQAQLAAVAADNAEGVVIPDQSEEIKALTDTMQQQLAKIEELQAQLAERPQTVTNTVYIERETDEEDNDDEEEWDSILDEEDDFIEATIVDEDGTVRKTTPNFRMRLKESSDKNREWYSAIKNLFCSQKGVTYRVYKRVEKIRYQGQVIAVIGIAKRSIKLWLALKPYEYDARRYHHKDVSDKPRFVDVPLFVRVGSDRALTRAEELILALFQEQAMESRKRYNDRSIQELIFTLKHNRLLGNKETKQLLCEVMHVHDCDVLDNETAEKCIETKNVDFIDDSVIEQVKLDDIDANFQDGNRITLDKLRKAGLVSAECTGYTVTAGQRLTKPLIIVANDFTMEAIKLIALTGGRVIKLSQV